LKPIRVQKPLGLVARNVKILPWSSIQQTSIWEMTYWKTSLTSPKAKIRPDTLGGRKSGGQTEEKSAAECQNSHEITEKTKGLKNSCKSN